MNIQDYLEEKKQLHKKLLEFLENESNVEEYFQNLVGLIHDQKIHDNREELKAILRLIIKIANNHKRTSDFFNKIEQFINIFKENIKQTFSNYEIFDIIKSNKRIILYFIEEKLIVPDESILHKLMPENLTFSNMKYIRSLYPFYFFNEFKIKIQQKFPNEEHEAYSKMNLELFEKKRKIGENDSHICELIRNDLIEEFISYVNKTNFSLSSTIESSIFETNSFLLKNEPTLIEYSAFFGSTQIFKYLYLNDVKLTPSLWIYAIHGNSPELFHILEEMKIKPQDESFNEVIKEAIKCHHFDIINYIQSNFMQSQIEENNYALSQSIKYNNYSYFPTDLNNESVFYDLCQYDYFTIVKIFLNSMSIDVNKLIIQN